MPSLHDRDKFGNTTAENKKLAMIEAGS